MSKRDDFLLIEDMYDSANKIVRYVDNMTFEQFKIDDKTIDAVVRNFEIIGEAANHVSSKMKENNSNIEWHRLRGFRNRIVHDYFGVDIQIVWTIIKDYLETLILELKPLLKK